MRGLSLYHDFELNSVAFNINHLDTQYSKSTEKKSPVLSIISLAQTDVVVYDNRYNAVKIILEWTPSVMRRTVTNFSLWIHIKKIKTKKYKKNCVFLNTHLFRTYSICCDYKELLRKVFKCQNLHQVRTCDFKALSINKIFLKT